MITLTKHSYDWNPGSIYTRMSAAVISEQEGDRKHLFSKVPAGTARVYDVEPGPGTRMHGAWQCGQTSVCHLEAATAPSGGFNEDEAQGSRDGDRKCQA